MERNPQQAFDRLLQAIENGEPRSVPVTPAEREAADLYAVAQRLQPLRQVELSAAARRRILAQALNATPAQRAPLRLVVNRPVRRDWVRAVGSMAASVAAVVVLGYGTLSASAASLPNSPLYSVRVLVEDVRVAVAPADLKPHLYAEQAARRIEETGALLESGRIVEAEVVADNAARRLESARAAADVVARPDARGAVTTASEAARVVFERLEQQGGTSPRVPNEIVAQPPSTPVRTSAPTVLEPTSASTVEPSSVSTEPTAPIAEAANATVAPAGVGAPAGQTSFTPIAAVANPAATTQARPTAEAVLSAPQPAFTPIGNTRATAAAPVSMGAPAATAFAPIETGATLTPRSTPTPMPTPRPSLSPATALASPTPTPTRTELPVTATPLPLRGEGAPGGAVAPIPIRTPGGRAVD